MEVIPDDEGEEIEYRSCPRLWTKHAAMMDFFDLMEHMEKYPHLAKPYFEERPRYLAFKKYFTAKVAEFEAMKKTGV